MAQREEVSLHGVVSEEAHDGLLSRLRHICKTSTQDYRSVTAYALPLPEAKDLGDSRVRITHLLPAIDDEPNEERVPTEAPWRIDHLSRPKMIRKETSESSSAQDSALYEMCSLCSVHGCESGSPPFGFLSSLGFRVIGEFQSEGFEFLFGSVVCRVTKIYHQYVIQPEKKLDRPPPLDDSKWHVEITQSVEKGLSHRQLSEPLVNLGQVLLPWVHFTKPDFILLYSQQKDQVTEK